MPAECFTLPLGRRVRVTRLDACGRPVYGECSQVVSKGFTQVQLTAQTEENQTDAVTTASNEICVPSTSTTEVTGYQVQIDFCLVDPDLALLMNDHWRPVVNDEGATIGWQQIGGLPTNGYALEIWTDVQTTAGNPCAGGAAGQGAWGYFLIPWLVGAAPGDLTISNQPVTFSFTGTTRRGSGWGRGPYQVQIVNGRPDRLRDPVDPNADIVPFKTGVRPPEASCGCQPVDRPTPDPAELFISGQPGEQPRLTVRMRIDNHGFGPVTVDWGDGSGTQEAADGATVAHTYPDPAGTPTQYTITVRDKQSPVVAATRTVTIPLPPDNPDLTASAVAGQPMAVAITWDNHGNGPVSIDWGDGTAAQPGEDAGTFTYTYAVPGVYTITVTDVDQTTHRSRAAVSVPALDPPTISADADPADPTGRTFVLTITQDAGAGPVSIDWGDGTAAEDGPETGEVTHAYAADGAYTITVTNKSSPLSRASVEVTVTPAPAPVIEAVKDTADATGRTFTLTITQDAGAGPVNIDWGDGTAVEEGPETGDVSHAYAADGAYTITVTNQASQASATTDVTAGPA